MYLLEDTSGRPKGPGPGSLGVVLSSLWNHWDHTASGLRDIYEAAAASCSFKMKPYRKSASCTIPHNPAAGVSCVSEFGNLWSGLQTAENTCHRLTHFMNV